MVVLIFHVKGQCIDGDLCQAIVKYRDHEGVIVWQCSCPLPTCFGRLDPRLYKKKYRQTIGPALHVGSLGR